MAAQNGREQKSIPLTPTQGRIIKLLADGMNHSVEEIQRKCLSDELAPVSNHIMKLRVLIRPLGEDIRCIKADSRTFYQHIKAIPISEIRLAEELEEIDRETIVAIPYKQG